LKRFQATRKRRATPYAGLCFSKPVGRSSASLVVASLDLQLVRLLRDAIRTADIHGGKFCGGDRGVIRSCDILPRRPITPEPKILPRRRIHPTPRFEPRPVIHPTPRAEPQAPIAASDPQNPPVRTVSPIQPPWKQFVWQTPLAPPPILKVVRYKTDIPHKGSLLDLFI
jgi:hypothetical protein